MLEGLHNLSVDVGCGTGTEAARRLACLVLQSAIARRESRGAHSRDDYPNESIDWQRLEVAVRRAAGKDLHVVVRPRPEVGAANAHARQVELTRFRAATRVPVTGSVDQRQSSMTAIVRPSSNTA